MPLKNFAYEPIEPAAKLLFWPGAALNWVLVIVALWSSDAILNHVVYALDAWRDESDFASYDQYWRSAQIYWAETWYACIISAGLIWWIRSVEGRPLSTAGFGPPPPGALTAGALAGIVLPAASIVLHAIPVSVPLVAAEAIQAPEWPIAVNIMAGVIFLLAIPSGAIAEEIVFRGWGLSAFAPVLGVWPAIITTSLLFAAIHIGPSDLGTWGQALSFASYVLIGVAFALMSIKFGLWSACVLHVANNMTLLTADLLVSGFDMRAVISAWDGERGTNDVNQAILGAIPTILFIAWLISRSTQAQPGQNGGASA